LREGEKGSGIPLQFFTFLVTYCSFTVSLNPSVNHAMRLLLAILLAASLGLADEPTLPKVKAKESATAKDKGEWFGKKVLPRRDPDTMLMGDWNGDKQEFWKPHNLLNCFVREDKDAWLRLYDGHREGWVKKEDMVTAEDAPAWWDKVVKEKPGDAFGWFMRGMSRHDNGEFDKAIADYTEVIRMKPEVSDGYNSRGNSWAEKKVFDKAIIDYTDAIRLDPKSENYFNNRGNVWREKKDYDKAISDYTEAIRLDPQYANAFRNRGYSWKSKKEYEKAIADYTEAIRIDPNESRVFNHAAWLYATCPDAKFRDGKKAVEFAKRLNDLDPSWWGYRSTLAAAYAENGEFELSVKEVKKAIELLKAEKNPDKDEIKKLDGQLELYRNKKPYRDE
jgi:tetratricopeptide (TPR) repeat protein